MTVEDLILEEMAKGMNLYFSYERGSHVFVMTVSNNRKLMERYQQFFDGAVTAAGASNRNWRNTTNEARGYWQWSVMRYDAYIFSRKIIPHLAKHDKYRFQFCQALMIRYMEDEGNPNRQDRSRSA